ncbi:DUF1152 domain-containing protein [Streptomyces lavendofoliae]|uniref:DUF1152 domain-containing protein n=1 Tax=Streptomyces lavendofoliae TaxID=67314 RepID=UPI003D89C369
MNDVFIAAGGGGDPVGTVIVAAAVSSAATGAGAEATAGAGAGAGFGTGTGAGAATGAGGGRRPTVLTYAWERPEVDPTPGPLGNAHFTGLSRNGRRPAVITPAARPVPPAGSTLPRLAGDLPAGLLLLDPYEGLPGMAERIRRLACDGPGDGGGQVRIVDIGGDVLAHGDEETLCSPLVDALTLAACALAGVDATVYVAGPGTDGEIPQDVLLDRLGSRCLVPAAGDAATAATALSWHPSEASALFTAAIHGVRGTVRTAQHLIPLTDASARVHRLGLDEALRHNAVARRLLESGPRTLDEAADLAERLTGIHEIARERPGAHARPPARPGSLPSTPEQALEKLRAKANGARHVTYRFAARALGLTWQQIPALRAVLGTGGAVLTLP